MGLVTSTVTKKTVRVVWQDRSARLRKNASKATIERKEKIDEIAEEKFCFPFPLY